MNSSDPHHSREGGNPYDPRLHKGGIGNVSGRHDTRFFSELHNKPGFRHPAGEIAYKFAAGENAPQREMRA